MKLVKPKTGALEYVQEKEDLFFLGSETKKSSIVST